MGATKYKLYHSNDSAYKLNAFIFAYKIVIVRNINLNSKIHANNLKC